MCPTDCPLCDAGVEDDWHLIVNCPSTIEARRAAGLEDLVTSRLSRHTTVTALILDICRTADRDIAGRFATLIWTLWQNRNNMVWQDEQECGQRVGVNAHQFWLDWLQLQNLQHHGVARNEQLQQQGHWQTPPVGWFKCNTDAGFHDAPNKTSAGWILRNSTGNFVLARTAWYHGNTP
jgi:hypothetical protein